MLIAHPYFFIRMFHIPSYVTMELYANLMAFLIALTSLINEYLLFVMGLLQPVSRYHTLTLSRVIFVLAISITSLESLLSACENCVSSFVTSIAFFIETTISCIMNELPTTIISYPHSWISCCKRHHSWLSLFESLSSCQHLHHSTSYSSTLHFFCWSLRHLLSSSWKIWLAKFILWLY